MFHGNNSSLSLATPIQAFAICPRFEAHFKRFDFDFDRDKAGNNKLAKMPIIAMTTSSSINVKAFLEGIFITKINPKKSR